MPFAAALLWLIGLGQVGTVPVRTSAPPPAPAAKAEIVATYPHDPRAFTEGLFWQDGFLWESTGELGRSGIRKVRLIDGKVMASVAVEPPYYGEGIAPWNGTILSLTWKNQTGFRWSMKDFRKLGSFGYRGEGWALAADGQGGLIMSDGSPFLRFVDPATFKETRRLEVTDGGLPVTNLNELEVVDGEILANIWLSDVIARIDPKDGHVIGWIDVTELHRQSGATEENDIPNGIAWDAKKRRLFVTGKDWPYVFEIKAPKDVKPD